MKENVQDQRLQMDMEELRARLAESEGARAAAEARADTAEARADTAEARADTAEARADTAEAKVVQYGILAKFSIMETYMPENLGRCLPPIKINTLVKPSVSGTERSGQSIPNAEIAQCDADTWANPSSITIPYMQQGKYLQSILGATSDGTSLTYLNEVDVQGFCLGILKDAVRSLGLARLLEVHQEVSLYAMVPDFIVFTHKGRIIFVVEVKAPEHFPGQVFKEPRVGGQIWMYLMSMKQHGCQRPIGAVMTYNKICLASLDDLGRLSHHRERVKNAVESLRDEVVPGRVTEQSTSNSKKNTISPSHERESVTSVNKKFIGSFNSDDECVVDPKVYLSQVFADGDVFPILLQALHIAYNDCISQDIQTRLPIVEDAEDLSRRLLLKIGPDSMKFVYAQNGLTAKAFSFHLAAAKQFLILATLGTGKTGTVYLVCTNRGLLAAAKVFVPAASTKATPAARNKDWEERVEVLEIECQKECDRWDLLYKRRKARATTLNMLPALLMPYGKEVSKPEDRQKSLSEVEKELRRFAEAGYVYAGTDLRWRHVFRDHGGNLFLGDLESLVERRGRVDDAVTNQMNELTSRMKEPGSLTNDADQLGCDDAKGKRPAEAVSFWITAANMKYFRKQQP